jgi:hypothetical protein
MASIEDSVPLGISVDLVENVDGEWKFNEKQDLGNVLQSHKKTVLFAVPGRFIFQNLK